MNLRTTIASCLIVFCGYTSLAINLASPVFENAAVEQTNSGYIKLGWSLPADAVPLANAQFELQQADNKEFKNPKVIYLGEDFATFLSGLPDGDLYHRVRSVSENESSDWSSTVVVKVRHHPLELALTLFGLGALVFAFTVGIVIQGVRRVNA